MHNRKRVLTSAGLLDNLGGLLLGLEKGLDTCRVGCGLWRSVKARLSKEMVILSTSQVKADAK